MPLIAHFNVVCVWVAGPSSPRLSSRSALAFAHFVEGNALCRAAQLCSSGERRFALAAVLAPGRRGGAAREAIRYDLQRSSPSTATARQRHALLGDAAVHPYLGLPADLAFIEDGNKDEVEVEVAAAPAPTAAARGGADGEATTTKRT